MSRGKPKLVTGVIGDDVHVVGLRLIEHALRSHGHDVVSLGVMVPAPEFVDAAQETNAAAVIISSSNGHAEVFVSGLKEQFLEAGLDDTLLYLGGRLAIGRPDWDQVCAHYRSFGLDRVYPSHTPLSEFIADLDRDLVQRGWEVPSHADPQQATR